MIFLDSSYLIAVLLKNDTNTNKSLKLKPILKYEQKIINNTVINEVLNSLTKINSEYDFDSITKLLFFYNVNFLNREDYLDTIRLFKYYNYAINFSDCTILKTMTNNKINIIVSFNSDFDKINGINRIYI